MAKKLLPPPVRPLGEALKEAIRECGLSLNELARQTGVSDPQLSRFMTGARSLSLPVAEVLQVYFGLDVVKRKK